MFCTPALIKILAHATPAAPTPAMTTLELFHLLADDLERVDERRQRDHRGAVLIVVEDRDVEPLLQLFLDLETVRRGDVFEVDAAEARRDAHDGLDDLVGVLRVEADRERVDAAEAP